MGKYSIKVKDGSKKITIQIKEDGALKSNVSLATIDHFFMKRNFQSKEEFLKVSREKGYKFSEDSEVYVSYKHKKEEKKLNVIYDHCDYIDFLSKYYCIFKKPGEFNDVEIDLIRDYEDIHQAVTNFVDKLDDKVKTGELIPRISVNKEVKSSIKKCLINYSGANYSVKEKSTAKGKAFKDEEKKWMTIGPSITKRYKFIRSLIHGDRDKEKLMEKLGLLKEDVILYNKVLDECFKTVSQSKEEQTDMFTKLGSNSSLVEPNYPRREFNPDSYPLEDLDDVRRSRTK